MRTESKTTADITIEQGQYPTSSPPPNFPGRAGATSAAPFYVAGAEVPSDAATRPGPGPGAPQQAYPPRDQTPRLPSTGKAPAPINTSPPPPTNAYSAYAPPLATQQRPQSTYGAQELATSVYDSPIAPHNPNSAATYSSSVYSPDDPYGSAPGGPAAVAGATATGVPAPHYQSYQPPAPAGYDGPLGGAPPPVPTGAAPPIPGVPQGRPQSMLPHDARSSLPSQMGAGGQPQYKPYVPPVAEGPSAPSAPPSDYYRSSGNVY